MNILRLFRARPLTFVLSLVLLVLVGRAVGLGKPLPAGPDAATQPILIADGAPGEWDESIREIGNVLLDTDDPRPDYRYKAFYSGYRGAYQNSNVFVGYAHSADGRIWIRGKRAHNCPAEDPYVVRSGDRYFMYYENKADVPFRNIHLAISDDRCESWRPVICNPVLAPKAGGGPAGWESSDVSSPVVWIDRNGMWQMLYEGRGDDFRGRIGHAVSGDGLIWRRSSREPVFGPGPSGAWDSHSVVPDDVWIHGKQVRLIYHGCGEAEDARYEVGCAVTDDLQTWKRCAANPFVTCADTAMWLPTNSTSVILVGPSGIVRYPARLDY